MKYKPAATAPHPQLIPLLEKNGLTHAQFVARGRPPKTSPRNLLQARSSIVTELHLSGLTWAELIEVTGLSQPSIARMTGAKWSEVPRSHRSASGIRTGKLWAGRKRPGQLEKQWASGAFDRLRGRPITEDTRLKILASYTPERREKMSRAGLARWARGEFRARLLSRFRTPEERLRRSLRQTERMVRYPWRYSRGRSGWVEAVKGATTKIYARSSYEMAAVRRLDSDSEVIRWEHERRFPTDDGRWILPDFLVWTSSAKVLLIEVKASWVYGLPREDRVHKRLAQAAELARERGWEFVVWTEKELEPWFPKKNGAPNSVPLLRPEPSESVLSPLTGK